MTPPDRDRDLERLEDRVEDLENEREALAPIPAQVVEIGKTSDRLWEMARSADEREDRRIAGLHDKIETLTKEMRDEMTRRFDKADADHARLAPPPSSWGDRFKLIVAASAGISVPIAVAIITTKGV